MMPWVMAAFLGRAEFVEPMQRLTAHGGKIPPRPSFRTIPQADSVYIRSPANGRISAQQGGSHEDHIVRSFAARVDFRRRDGGRAAVPLQRSGVDQWTLAAQFEGV